MTRPTPLGIITYSLSFGFSNPIPPFPLLLSGLGCHRRSSSMLNSSPFNSGLLTPCHFSFISVYLSAYRHADGMKLVGCLDPLVFNQ
ncbi:hypothetical protein P3L10_013165 [Capsicum annuum]